MSTFLIFLACTQVSWDTADPGRRSESVSESDGSGSSGAGADDTGFSASWSEGEDTDCISDDPSGTIRRLRITTSESPSWVAWSEVRVEGSLDGAASRDVTGDAWLSASSGEELVDLATDGDDSTAWNAEDFAPQWLQLNFDAPLALDALQLTIAQSPSGSTEHTIEVASECASLEPLETFEGTTVSGQELSYSTPTGDGNCGEMIFDLVLKKTSAPCWDCEFWFDPMDVEEQRPRLEVTYSVGGASQTAVFQDGPLGTDGELTSTFIMGADALLGPGSCAFGDEGCYADFLHKVRTQVWDGVHYYNGLIRSDISSLPCEATIQEAKLWLHIHEERGLANADSSSTASFYRGVRDWDYRYVHGLRYNVDSAGNDLAWTTPGGDIGALVKEIEAQDDFWDRGFNKASPDAWFDFTDYVADLQAER